MHKYFRLILSGCLLGFVGFAQLAQARTVNVAIPCYCFQYLPFFIAKDKGYYREEDIDAQIIVMGGGVGLRALIGSNVDFAATGEPAVLSANISGARLQILFSAYYKPLLWLYSDPKIKSVADLKGKKIAISGIGSATDTLTRDLLKKRGLDGGREVAMLAMGSPEARFIALKTGNVDAAVLSEGFKFTRGRSGTAGVGFLSERRCFLAFGQHRRAGQLHQNRRAADRKVYPRDHKRIALRPRKSRRHLALCGENIESQRRPGSEDL